MNFSQLDHIILNNDLVTCSFVTSYINYASYHKSIVLRLATEETCFLPTFKDKVYFDREKHLKKCETSKNSSKSTEKADMDGNPSPYEGQDSYQFYANKAKKSNLKRKGPQTDKNQARRVQRNQCMKLNLQWRCHQNNTRNIQMI